MVKIIASHFYTNFGKAPFGDHHLFILSLSRNNFEGRSIKAGNDALNQRHYIEIANF